MIFRTRKQLFQTKFGLKGLILLRENSNNIVNEDLPFLIYCGLISLQPQVTFEDIDEIIKTNDTSNFQRPSFLPTQLEIQELYTKAVGEIGIAPQDFYTMTPEEINVAYEGYLRKKETEVNLIKLAVMEGINNNNQLIRLTEDKGYSIGNLEERENTFQALQIYDQGVYQ